MWRSATIPIRTGTASWRNVRDCMNPNHYLAVAIRYLLTHRPKWSEQEAVGKTLVSSSMIDRVVRRWVANWRRCRWASSGSPPGLFDGTVCFGGKKAPEPVFGARRKGLDHRQRRYYHQPAGR